MVEGFLVGGIHQVVPELAIEFPLMPLRVGGDCFGNILQGLEMRCGVAVTEGVVRDDIEALPEELLELGVHVVENFKSQASEGIKVSGWPRICRRVSRCWE